MSAPPYDDQVSLPSIPQSDGSMVDETVNREIISKVQRELDSSLGWTGTRLAEARRLRLSEYLGNPRGDEREGFSQVITRDTFEQVEQILPGLMEIFTAGNEVAVFHPERADQEEQAQQATDLCNWIFRKEEGFMALYTMFKDALIQKNGIIKVWWEDTEESRVERYEGKTFIEANEILADPNFTVEAWDPYIEGAEGPRPVSPEELELPGMLEAVLFNVEGTRVVKEGRCRLENIPPEEFGLNRDARSLKDPTCRFVYQRIRSSVSQLVAWGVPEERAKRLPGAQSVYSTDQDAIIRASQDDSFPLVYSYRDDSEKTVWVSDNYIKLDLNGDGISEWYRVLTAGDYSEELLGWEEVDGHPFVSCTPIPIPHRFYGLGLADITGDLQVINTTLWRQFLNSSYLATDPRTVVLSRGDGEDARPMANISQLLNAVPGGYIEEYEQGALRPFVQENNTGDILPAFEVHEKMKQNRTGISPDAMGINPEAISKHVFGAMVQTSAAAQRITLYARIFAETGVKHLFEQIYKCLQQNHQRGIAVRLRGQWIETDPTDWVEKMDCTVSVGLGHGSRMEKAIHLQTIGEIQKAIAEAGLAHMVTPQNVYNAASAGIENMGFKDPSQFVTDPTTVPPPEPKEDPAEELVRMEAQAKIMELEIQRQKLENERAELMLKGKEIELSHEADIQRLRLEYDKEGVPFDDASFTLARGLRPRGPVPTSGRGGLANGGGAPGLDEAFMAAQAEIQRQEAQRGSPA